MTILTASIAQVNLGAFQLEGLRDEQGNFHVALPQMVSLNLVPPNRSAKQLEALTGAGFQSNGVKLRTPLNSKAVNAIPLSCFEMLLFNLALSGNEKAIALSRALIGLSLTQIFSDAFGQKFEKSDREKWLTTRFKTKHDFRPLTDKLKSSGFAQPWEYGQFVHAMQSRIGVKNGSRDFLEFEVLLRLERAQDRLITYMEFGLSPYDALEKLKVETL